MLRQDVLGKVVRKRVAVTWSCYATRKMYGERVLKPKDVEEQWPDCTMLDAMAGNPKGAQSWQRGEKLGNISLLQISKLKAEHVVVANSDQD